MAAFSSPRVVLEGFGGDIQKQSTGGVLIFFNDLLPTSDLGTLCSDLPSINHAEWCNAAGRARPSMSLINLPETNNRNCVLKTLHAKHQTRRWFYAGFFFFFKSVLGSLSTFLWILNFAVAVSPE